MFRLSQTTTATLQPWFPHQRFEDVRIVTTGPVCWFVRAVLRQGAMTFAPYVFYGRATFDPSVERTLPLLAHELKHIEQYWRHGHIGFLVRYFWDRARHGFRYGRQLPLEAEAYALQDEVAIALGLQ